MEDFPDYVWLPEVNRNIIENIVEYTTNHDILWWIWGFNIKWTRWTKISLFSVVLLSLFNRFQAIRHVFRWKNMVVTCPTTAHVGSSTIACLTRPWLGFQGKMKNRRIAGKRTDIMLYIYMHDIYIYRHLWYIRIYIYTHLWYIYIYIYI